MLNRIANWLTLPRLIVALTFVAIFAMSARISVDTDTWWHLRTGQWIVAHGAVPQADVFSHTRAGEPWRIPGWIVQVPLYWLFANLGYAGLNLFTAFFVTLTFALVYPACSGHPLLRAFMLVLAATASGIYWSARPQIVSLALAAAFALVLYRWRARGLPTELLWLPLLMALWANAHGGFAIGFILIALTGAGEALKFGWSWLEAWRSGKRSAALVRRSSSLLWLALITLVCAVAVTLNPAGPEMLLYPFKTVSIGALREFIQEWQSPNFHHIEQQPFLWLLLATLGVAALSGRRVDVTDLVLVGATAYMGFLAGRNMPLLAIVAPPLLTRHAAYLLEDARQRLVATHPHAAASGARPPDEAHPSIVEVDTVSTRGNIALNWLLLTVLTGVALLKITTVLPARLNEAELRQQVPMEAAAYIRRERPPGPMFNSYNYGAYLMWALYPDYPVYTDGRTDLYDDAFLREYLQVSLGREVWREVFARYDIRLVVVERDSFLAAVLRREPGWAATYEDDLAVVLVRR